MVSPAPMDYPDLGRRVEVVECLIQRGEGDPGLVEALRRGVEGDWE